MELLTNGLIEQMLKSMDSSPVNPTREQKFLAFTICKNLADLGTTGMAILKEMRAKRLPINDLPDLSSIQLCQGIIKDFYSDQMFKEDPDFGNVPVWSVIAKFDLKKTEIAYRIYRGIRENVVGKPKSKDLQKAIYDRNKKFFIENFDEIFSDIPFKEGLIVFKNFIKSPHVSKENQNYVWDFFESFIDIYIHESENLADLKKM